MRTKTLLLTAALGAAGLASSMAQVYSVNAVGYVNVTIPVSQTLASTFALVANPLNGTNNLIGTVLPNVPDASVVWALRSGAFDSSTYFDGEWSPNTLTLDPGEGVFLQLDPAFAPNPTTITFVGEVPQGSLSNPIPPGLSLRASQVPQSAPLGQLGLVPAEGDEVYFFDRANQRYYESYVYAGGSWITADPGLPAEPTPAVAESFWYNNTAAGPNNWNRTFNLN